MTGSLVSLVDSWAGKIPCQLFSCCFSPNGLKCAIAAEDNNIYLIDTFGCL